jgi:hypothetical protein
MNRSPFNKGGERGIIPLVEERIKNILTQKD